MKISPINNFIKNPLSPFNKENKSLGTNSAVQNPINLNNIPHYQPLFSGSRQTIEEGLKKLIERDNFPQEREIFANLATEVLNDGNKNQRKIMEGFAINIIYLMEKGEDYSHQIKLCEKILSNEFFYNNHAIPQNIDTFLNTDKEDAEAKIQMMDKLLSDERLTSNQSISTSLINIINHQNKETTPDRIKLIDKILSEDTLCVESEFTKSIADLLTDKNKTENIQEQLQIIDTIAKNECFYKNEKFMQQITVSLRMQPLEKVAMVLDKILSDECLYKNEEIVSNLPTALISMCDNDADIKFPLAVFDLYCEDEKLQKSKFVPESILKIAQASTDERKFNIAKKFLTTPRLYKQEVLNFSQRSAFDCNISDILSDAKSPEAEELISIVFDNEDFTYNLAPFLHNVFGYSGPEEIKNKTVLLNKVINNKKIKHNKFFDKYIHNILYRTENKEHIKLAEKILTNEKLQQEIIFDDIEVIFGCACNENPVELKIMNKILDNEYLYSNDDVRETFFNYCYDDVMPCSPKEEEFIHKILSNKTLVEKTDLISNLENVLRTVRNYDFEDIAISTIDKLSNDKKYLENPLIVNVAARIVSCCETKEQQETTFDFLDFFLSNKKYYENPNAASNFWIMIHCLQDKEDAEILKTVFQNDFLLNYDEKFCEDPFSSGTYNLLFILINHMKEIETPYQREIVKRILTEEKLYERPKLLHHIPELIANTKTQADLDYKNKILDEIVKDERLFSNTDSMFLYHFIANNNMEELCGDEEYIDAIVEMIKTIRTDERLIGNECVIAYLDEIISGSDRRSLEYQKTFIDNLFKNEKLSKNENVIKNLGQIILVAGSHSEEERKFLDRILADEKYYNTPAIMNNIHDLAMRFNSINSKFVEKVLASEDLYKNEMFMNKLSSILRSTNTQFRREILDYVFEDKELILNEDFINGFFNFIFLVQMDNVEETKKYIDSLKEGEISAMQIGVLLGHKDSISYRRVAQANKIIGREKLQSMSKEEEIMAYKFLRLYHKENINELSTDSKKSFLKKLINANDSLFRNSNNLREMFPLLPTNKTEYCELLPAIVNAIGIETATLNKEKINDFSTSLTNLSTTLSELSDEEFNNLSFEQEYTKQEFFDDVYKLIKNLDKNKQQKIYDYFGFEFHHNKTGSIISENGTRYSITGYPANLHNGKKLAQIKNEKVKEIIEEIRPLVIKFTENNKIHSNNKEIENAINETATIFPEIRTLIGKVQHSTHDFDIMKHSLKVMQKIAQNPNFKDLSDSDKNVLLISSLLHDITKKEGTTDSTHALQSSFDGFYITQKLKLSNDEKIKIYSLIKHHEWLADINKSNKDDRKIKSIAYDLHYGNLFNLAKIFTEADLKAVKRNDLFFENYKSDYINISNKIEELITELKKSQPLLPITKFPTASRIKQEITTVNEDFSTNLKGIYQDKNGMVIIKFNEVENETWEKIGFPKGSISKGIKAIDSKGQEVNTGNIKFFVHGLDAKDNLRRFDAFALPDSDALLSVSYAERPESKYRFFRNQGVIINADSKYIHGGGKTDSGSGNGKNIDDFKEKYAYEDGRRHEDRLFISKLIKEHLNLSEEEYQTLVEENKNKPLCAIEPKELQEEIIKALATINSHTRHGERNYNEMYLSNPEVMGVFAYEKDYRIDTTKNFILNQKDFIKEYALEKDIPFVIFGE